MEQTNFQAASGPLLNLLNQQRQSCNQAAADNSPDLFRQPLNKDEKAREKKKTNRF